MTPREQRVADEYKRRRSLFPIYVIDPNGYTAPAPEMSDEDALFLATMAFSNTDKWYRKERNA